MRKFDPKEEPLKEIHQLMIGGISPRPIALVATVDEQGNQNLAPFSFFNAFGANPPMIAFSPARSGRTGKFKDTYTNLMATGECTVQLVTYEICEQVNLSSVEVSSEIDEFQISGLTPLLSDLVKAPRVAESPFQMECKLYKMEHLGEGNGSGCLAICEIVKFHVAEHLFDAEGRIDPEVLDVVGRNGKNFYTRAKGEALFEVPNCQGKEIIGWEGLPSAMRESEVYTGNILARFANVLELPGNAAISAEKEKYAGASRQELEEYAKDALLAGESDRAWALALAALDF